MRHAITFLTTLILVIPAFTAASVDAQARLGLSIGYSSGSGDSPSVSNGGLSAGGHLLFGSGVELGGGLDVSSYGVTGVSDSYSQLDAYFLAQYPVELAGPAFVLGARAGYTRLAFGSTADDGLFLGPRLGLRLWRGPVAFEVTGDVLFNRYTEVRALGDSQRVDGASDVRFVVRAGVAIPLR
jgi:hypothetical protein